MVHPCESVVAEKFKVAMLKLANSRMRDFNDVAELAPQFEFDGQVRTDAFAATYRLTISSGRF